MPLVVDSYDPATFDRLKCPHCSAMLEFENPTKRASGCAESSFGVKCWKCDEVTEVQGLRVRLGKHGTDAAPLSSEYYDILGVKPDATQAEIRKAYYVLAMKYHPDKNKDDPQAEERFKKLSEVYQVLYDPELRRKYNEHGSIKPEEGFADPEEFFKKQFGGGKFVDLIGEISIAQDFKAALNASDDQEDLKDTGKAVTDAKDPRKKAEAEARLQERLRLRDERVAKLAATLKRKLTFYTEGGGTPEQFRQLVELEAEELRTENYGVELLNTIGYVYLTKAKSALGDVILGKLWGAIKEKSHIFSETVSTVRSAVELESHYTLLKKAEEEGATLDKKQALEAEAAEKGMTALWKTSKMEVEAVLRQVCDKVLTEEGVSKALLTKRAEGLKIVGEVYSEVSRGDSNGTKPGKKGAASP